MRRGNENTWLLGYPNDAVSIDVFANTVHACALRTPCFAWRCALMEVPLEPHTGTFFLGKFASLPYIPLLAFRSSLGE